MGYSLYLADKNGEVAQGEKRTNLGNMICIGGTNDLEFNITFNYDPYYKEVEGFEEDSIRKIYGLTGKESLPLLEKIRSSIENKYSTEDDDWITTKHEVTEFYVDGKRVDAGDVVWAVANKKRVEQRKRKIDVYEGDTNDYWATTAANAYVAILQLMKMARECPEGIWHGD